MAIYYGDSVKGRAAVIVGESIRLTIPSTIPWAAQIQTAALFIDCLCIIDNSTWDALLPCISPLNFSGTYFT